MPCGAIDASTSRSPEVNDDCHPMVLAREPRRRAAVFAAGAATMALRRRPPTNLSAPRCRFGAAARRARAGRAPPDRHRELDGLKQQLETMRTRAARAEATARDAQAPPRGPGASRDARPMRATPRRRFATSRRGTPPTTAHRPRPTPSTGSSASSPRRRRSLATSARLSIVRGATRRPRPATSSSCRAGWVRARPSWPSARSRCARCRPSTSSCSDGSTMPRACAPTTFACGRSRPNPSS